MKKENGSKCTLEFANTFANRLKKAREHTGFTQEEVAEYLNIDIRTYKKFETVLEPGNMKNDPDRKGQRTPNFEQIKKLSEKLECDITYLSGDNEECEYRKDISAASDTTGLGYDTISILEKIKNSHKPDNTDFFDRKILFLLDYLLNEFGGRYILWNLFHYLFKEYSFMISSDGSGSNAIVLEDESGIDERNVSLYVNEISEQTFYSNITTSVVKLKEYIKKTNKNIHDKIIKYEYTPTKQEIQNKISLIEKDISNAQNNPYKKNNPYTPAYALKIRHHEDTGKWDDFPTLADLIERRVRFDTANQEYVDKLTQTKESLTQKLDKISSP